MPWLNRLTTIVGLAALANLLVFIAIAIAIGGDAINGHQQGGHYFLASHGTLTEVSRNVFTYSKVHSIAVMVTVPLAVLLSLASSAAKIARNLRLSG
jgi:hypothetical protein